MTTLATTGQYVDEVGNLSDETKLPRELLSRFDEMWRNRERPFFSQVSEDGTMPLDALRELIRTLKVSSTLLCNSIARVIAEGASDITFAQFVRGYAKMNSRTLKEALPFAFAVFDMDEDGKIGQEEFTQVINANLEMQDMDSSVLNRVLKTKDGQDAATGITYDGFRWFASLTSETILAACGFCLHVRDFYVPLVPLGTEEEEAAEEAAKAEERRRAREREHAPQQPASATAGDVSEPDPERNPFEDPDVLAALESLKTTPEERAERCKTKGNDAMKHKKAGVEKAVELYTSGLDEKCSDAVLNATLLSNRAAAHTTLKNWGKALSDASDALKSEVLPEQTQLKACRRGANAALQLNKLSEVERLVTHADTLLKGMPPEAADGADALELRKIGLQAETKREEERQKRLEAEAAALREKELKAAISKRGLAVGDFPDAALREQCVGERSGAHIWYDPEVDELHWPALLLYPEHGQSDLIQDFSEGEALLPHLHEMFGEQGENAPPWDEFRQYRARRLNVYIPFTHPERDEEVVLPIRVDLPMLDQLRRAQPLGYQIPGVPILNVVVKGSDYEKRFFLNRLAK